MEGDTQIDATIPPSSMGSEEGRPSRVQALMTPTIGGQTSTRDVSAARLTSSTEIILGEVKKHKLGLALTVAGLILLAGSVAIIWMKFFARRNREKTACG